MSKGNTFELDVLKLIFNATAIANIADNAATSPLTQLFVALHTADPGEAGDQTSSEATYTGYARVAVNRTSGGWTASANPVVNAGTITFPACTGGSNTITHWSVGVVTSGASKILYSGALTAGLKTFTAVASTDTIVAPGTSFVVNDQVSMYSTPAAVLPTGVNESQLYFIKTVSGTSYTISTTQGGATLDITADGAGLIAKDATLVVSSGITPTFAASALSITED